MSILTSEEIATIKSMGIYWEEVAQRENGGQILRQEMQQLYSMFGLKLLWIALEYAKNESSANHKAAQGCTYDTEVCSHPERGTGAGNLAFWLAPVGHCYTTEETEVLALLELVRITNGERARV